MDSTDQRLDLLRPFLGDLPADTFGPTFDAITRRLDRYVKALASEIAGALDLRPGDHPEIDETLRRRSWSVEGRWGLQWLFETLELFHDAERIPGGWRLSEPRSTGTAAELREAACSLAPETAPAYDVLRLAAESLPAVLDGSARGEEVLFGPASLGLWFEYFSNSNPHYAVSNRLVAFGAVRLLPARAAIIEVGGGGGSAAEAVMGALDRAGRPPGRFLFTEIQRVFLRRGAGRVQAAAPGGCTVESRCFDVNEDPASLELPAAGFDAVVAVNTLHLALDVPATLRRLASLLVPGGALILGELVRPAATGAVHIELPFTLLESFRRTPLDADMRPRPGFMTLAGWREAFRRAGLGEIAILPAELERCQEIYPGFYGAALIATS